jgi:hypothetical protein
VKRPFKPAATSSTSGDHEQEISLDGDRWSGFRDRFGEREVGIDSNGTPIELLRLVKEFTPVEEPLAERVAKLKRFERAGIARAFRVEHDDNKVRPRLVLVSERIAGMRLSELLTRGIGQSAVPDIGAAMFVMRRLFAAADSVRKASNIAHLAIAPERVIITPRAEVVIVEIAIAGAIEALLASHSWPKSMPLVNVDADPARDGHRIDIARIARIGIAMMLGRTLEPSETVDALSPVITEISDVCAIRAGDGFAKSFGQWLEHAITIDAGMSFPDFHEAGLALGRVETPKDCRASRKTLRQFIADLAIDDFSHTDLTTIEADRIREIRVRQTTSRPLAPKAAALAKLGASSDFRTGTKYCRSRRRSLKNRQPSSATWRSNSAS